MNTLYIHNFNKFSGELLLDIPICIGGFPDGTVVKNPPANARDTRDSGSISGSGRSSWVGNSNSLQYFCLENSMDRGAWQAIVHGVTKDLDTTERLSDESNSSIQTSAVLSQLISKNCRSCPLSSVSSSMRAGSARPSSQRIHLSPQSPAKLLK